MVALSEFEILLAGPAGNGCEAVNADRVKGAVAIEAMMRQPGRLGERPRIGFRRGGPDPGDDLLNLLIEIDNTACRLLYS